MAKEALAPNQVCPWHRIEEACALGVFGEIFEGLGRACEAIGS
ncbi:hypothetical protein F442_18138, partial [Phytophthora nicotianae P10297]